MKPFPLILLTALAFAVSGCSDLDRLTTPPLEMTVELKSPLATETTLTLSGNGLNETYTDNGTGLSTKALVWPGSYTATLSRLSVGPIIYQGVLAFSNASGNLSRNESLTFQVRSIDSGKLKISGSYRAITGSLQVRATGLPFGAQPRLSYQSADGVKKPFDPAQPAALNPGIYQIAFEEVTVENRTYTANPASVVVTVQAGTYTPVEVTYTGAP
jgi:hypothetical protein